jgi:CheY-like chemotaxis protein
MFYAQGPDPSIEGHPPMTHPSFFEHYPVASGQRFDRLRPSYQILPYMTNANLRILVVDDEEVVRLFIARVLEGMGYACDQAVDGKDALKKFSNGTQYDVVFLDLVMPRMDGETTLRELHQKYPDTRVIMVSVQDDEEAIKELLEKGATAYITKPLSLNDLEQIMDKLGGKRAT